MRRGAFFNKGSWATTNGYFAFLLLPILAVPVVAAYDPFASLTLYDGEWEVRAEHPWSGAPPGAVDRLTSHCHRFTAYFACEQTINGKTASIIVYTLASDGGFSTRTIAPNGLAGGRGGLSLSGRRWTYLDKPPPPLTGNWSRVENVIVDHDHIHFAEFTSADEGKTWQPVNSGDEVRQ